MPSRDGRALAIGSDVTTILMDHVTIASDVTTILMDHVTIASDVTTILSDHVTIASDVTTILSDHVTIASDVTTILSDHVTIASDVSTILSDHVTIASDVSTILSDHVTIASDVSTILSDHVTIASDVSTILSDHVTIASDVSTILSIEATILSDHVTIASDVSTILSDHVTIASDVSTILSDHVTIAFDVSTILSIEAMILSVEAMILSVEAMILSVEATILSIEATILSIEATILEREKLKSRNGLKCRGPRLPSRVIMGDMARFSRFDLRTTDANAARLFYARLLGHERASIWPLHEQALARGAKPHWLGQITVENAEQVAATFVERGAVQLGPTRKDEAGASVLTLRDPGGAVVAIASPSSDAGEPQVDVVWHVLNTKDAPRAVTNYREAFGWHVTGRVDLGAQGAFEQFAWNAGGPSVGSIGDIAGRPEVHPHWLFFFEVESLLQTINVVRALGGVALEPFELPNGDRTCVCDDPQGAAFALRERAWP